jgi:hypothetical protein
MAASGQKVPRKATKGHGFAVPPLYGIGAPNATEHGLDLLDEVQQTQLANFRGVLAVMRVYASYSPPARAPKGDW